MGRKALWIAATGACILGAGTLIREAGQSERSQALAQQAARLLHPPFDEAPAFQDIRATEARMLVDEAEELAATSDTRLLWIEARALEHLQRSNPTEARRELSRASPALSGSLRALAAAIELADRKLDAADQFVTAALKEGAEPRALALASDIARERGQADRALAFAEQGVAAHPSGALFERRGLARELLGELPAARADLERAAKLDARPTSSLLHLGRVLRDLGDLRGAVLAYSAATQRNPSESEAWLGSGICRVGLGDNVGARADFERAEELAPTRAAPVIGLGDLDAAERAWESAERHYRVATKLEPQLALGWLKLGNTLLRRGQTSAATAAYREAIARQPELAAAHNGLGAALQAQGDPETARVELEQAAKLDPRDPNPLYNLARLFRQQGDAEAADTALAQAQARSPETQ